METRCRNNEYQIPLLERSFHKQTVVIIHPDQYRTILHFGQMPQINSGSVQRPNIYFILAGSFQQKQSM